MGLVVLVTKTFDSFMDNTIRDRFLSLSLTVKIILMMKEGAALTPLLRLPLA